MHDVTVGIPETFTFENALASVLGCKGPTGRYTPVSVRPAPQKRGVWSESGQIHPLHLRPPNQLAMRVVHGEERHGGGRARRRRTRMSFAERRAGGQWRSMTRFQATLNKRAREEGREATPTRTRISRIGAFSCAHDAYSSTYRIRYFHVLRCTTWTSKKNALYWTS